MKKLLVLSFIAASFSVASAQTIIPISLYGYLDQYSLGSSSSSVGPDACVPTSTTNALTYLQNAFPTFYGTSLSGATYQDWVNTDTTLVAAMQTGVGEGTTDPLEVYGLTSYLDSLSLGDYYPTMSGVMSDAGWGGSYPRPSYITNGRPDATFLENALQGNAALITTITYLSGGGHCLLVNGIDWNAETNTGTLYFVDPLDPSQNYDDHEVLGPVLQTTGTLTLGESGDLHLTYNQYQGALPYHGDNFYVEEAYIDGALALYGVPEPTASVLVGFGLILVAVIWVRRRRFEAVLAGDRLIH